MMKRLALTIALAGLSGGALAADLRGPIIEAPPPLPVPVVAGFSWTGAYAGVNVGVGSASPQYSYNVNSPGSTQEGISPCDYPQYDPSGNFIGCGYSNTTNAFSNSGSQRLGSGGVLGGAQIGYNYAFSSGRFGGFGGFGVMPVVGVEADFDGSGVSSAASLGQAATGELTGASTYIGVGSQLKYFGTVRGRLGIAFDRLLVYGTGGFAYGEVDSYVTSPANGVYNTKSNFHTGIAYGGGLEFALTNNLLLRAEYLHLDLNRKGIVENGSVGSTGTTYSIYEKPSLDLVRAGISYKFDFARTVASPVVARY